MVLVCFKSILSSEKLEQVNVEEIKPMITLKDNAIKGIASQL